MIRVLDLYCGEGGAARGMAARGVLMYGVDNVDFSNRYPGLFIKQNVLGLDPDWIRRHFDFVWASPPCQFASALRHAPNAKRHRNLIPATRRLLDAAGLPYVIENVGEARPHLRNPVMLCGTMFKLGCVVNRHIAPRWLELQRHRLFECSGFRPAQMQCDHSGGPVIGVYGGHARIRAASHGGRGTAWPFDEAQAYCVALALGVPVGEMTLAGMSQAIPPAYARHILSNWRTVARK